MNWKTFRIAALAAALVIVAGITCAQGQTTVLATPEYRAWLAIAESMLGRIIVILGSEHVWTTLQGLAGQPTTEPLPEPTELTPGQLYTFRVPVAQIPTVQQQTIAAQPIPSAPIVSKPPISVPVTKI